MTGGREIFGLASVTIIIGYVLKLGFVPIWFFLATIALLGLVVGNELMKALQGGSAPVANATTGVTFQSTATRWMEDLKTREYELHQPEVHAWNCRNCGGPNSPAGEFCQYCGKAKQ